VVTSGTFDYLWILSRSPEMDEAVYSGLVRFAESSGFDVSRLERVEQERIFPR
jgi:lipocalin